MFENGRTCGGNNQYPLRVQDIIENFFVSFFTIEQTMRAGRSQKFPNDVYQLWRSLNGKNEFPMDDMVKFGTVKDLIMMGAAV